MNNWNTDIESQVKDMKEMVKMIEKIRKCSSCSSFIVTGSFSHDL